MNLRWKPAFFSVLLLVILTVSAGTALARAGGGQSYGGGGGSGSSGGGDGLGIIIYLLVRLCIEQPCIGIPLVIIIIVVSIIMKRRKVKKQYSTIQQAGNSRLNQKQDSVAMHNSITALKNRDQNFNQQIFSEKVKQAFLEVQQAWSDQDLSQVRRFISDGVHERFSLQIHMQKSQGMRNLMENVQVLGAEINSVDSDRHYDTIHVKITARAEDSDVDLESGKKLRDNYKGTFIEYWSFLRKPGVQTLAGRGLVEGVCPNCGATLELTDSGRCQYCDAVVTSGEYDWVLSEITQSVEWSTSSSHEAIPGFSQMSAADPGFNIQTIEDTSSVIFWRYIKSYFDGSADPVRKVSAESYSASLENSLQQTQDGNSHLYFQDAAVGAVEVQSITQGTDFDRIAVLVKWSARNSWISSSGKPGNSGPQTIRPQIFNLARRQGVKTIASQGLNSAHCPGCGAPYTGGDTGSCEYCGRPLNDGSGSWVLESIGPFSGSRVNSANVSPVSALPAVSADILLMAMAKVMYSDGELENEEMQLLTSFAGNRGISSDRLQTIISSIKEQDAVVPGPSNSAEALEILNAMVRMSLADGQIDQSEKDLLEKYAAGAGLSRNVVSSVINRQRKKLYKEIRKAGK